MPVDCGFDKSGRKESQRYRHVDLTHAASSTVGDAAGRGGGIIDELLEPPAPLRDRGNQRPSRLRANGTPVLRRWVGRQKNFALPCGWCLGPRNVEHVCAFWLAAVGSGSLVQFDDQLPKPNLDPRDVGIDKAAVVDSLGRLDMVANRLNDQILNLGSRDPAYRSGPLRLPLQN